MSIFIILCFVSLIIVLVILSFYRDQKDLCNETKMVEIKNRIKKAKEERKKKYDHYDHDWFDGL